MRNAWKFTFAAFVALLICEAVSGFLRGYLQHDGVPPALNLLAGGLNYAVPGSATILAILLYLGAAPATTGGVVRFLLMVQGIGMSIADLPLSRLRGRPLWPFVIFVPAGMILFHLARTRLGRGSGDQPKFSAEP